MTTASVYQVDDIWTCISNQQDKNRLITQLMWRNLASFVSGSYFSVYYSI